MDASEFPRLRAILLTQSSRFKAQYPHLEPKLTHVVYECFPQRPWSRRARDAGVARLKDVILSGSLGQDILLFGTRSFCVVGHGTPSPSDQQDQWSAEQRADPRFCSVCCTMLVHQHNRRTHELGLRHQTAVMQRLASRLSSQRQHAGSGQQAPQRDASSLVLTPSSLPDISVAPGDTATQSVVLTNVHASQTVTLTSCALLPAQPGVLIALHDVVSLQAYPIPLLLPPGTSVQLVITAKPLHLGVALLTLALELLPDDVVLRQFMLRCDRHDPSLPDIGPTAPFRRPTARPDYVPHNVNYEPGERPPQSKHKWAVPYGSHPVPREVQQAVQHCDKTALVARLGIVPTTMPQHIEKLRLLLHLEEVQQHVDIRQYDMRGVVMQPTARLLSLSVPGLAENRPSVLYGDKLYVRPSDGSSKGKEWQAFVHGVELTRVLLRFSAAFHMSFVPGRQYDVRFAISRTQYNIMHFATKELRSMAGADGIDPRTVLPAQLLPVPPVKSPSEPPGTQALRPFDAKLNVEQLAAVKRVLQGSHAPAPYVIFGPPGTGKTSTLLEAAAQLLRQSPSNRLLLVAPSNDAADLLAVRLLNIAGCQVSELKRICAYQRAKAADVDPLLIKVWNYDESAGAFVLPTKDVIMAKRVRVVVATCMMAAKMYASGVSRGHFTSILMDEAGHAVEPLALAALQLAGNNTQVVLAGDPCQLGPVVHSPLARTHGLELSFLERLVTALPYNRAPATPPAPASPAGVAPVLPPTDFDPRYVTQLLRNYRSHPALLQLPSELFYGGRLIASANREVTELLINRTAPDWLPNKKFPLLVHNLIGEDMREGSSPSWFNAMEAKKVLDLVEALKGLRSVRLSDADIGIITPYRKQVQKIRALLAGKGHAKVKVGSVEEFQGQERKVILLSTVRSNPDHLEFDRKHRLGFVSNPKRFNVSATRAKCLLVLVGNAHVLARDPHWLALLSYAHANGACGGSPMPDEVVSAGTGTSGTQPGGGAAGGQQLDNMMSRLTLGGTSSGAAAAAAADAWELLGNVLQTEGDEIPRHL